ncbi:carboxylesterase/lipase family protein [Thermomonospora umbrina]|uniref:Carboxylic ester hydrolase n=1 Tax=Thermomonospora umbrina TaxID=111806 RepID=A0A3D9SU32_9ACTN|nr:carboxylesterase family protein [Thermomonospora umbrina]REE95201.1 para-nitrobenzyl esterase [Thermomonospora umbrina]
MRPSTLVRRSAITVAACAFSVLPAVPAAADQPTVRTESGVVQSATEAGADRYLGLPYAQPPTGSLRWRPPEPAARWRGVRQATQAPPRCVQRTTAPTSEDCLYLNVYTPSGAAHGKRRYPVMVYVHGGALVSGTGSVYDPTALTRDDVIVVTLNYRLGALGFLAHPALTGSGGNYGLMDQQAALRWVQRNIGRFGGLPGKVTIFGESAGGLSVLSLLASPGSAGLFSAAINQSGAYALKLPGLSTARQQGTAFATAAGCADQSATCLRSLPTAQVLTHQGGSAFPTVDGTVLPRSLDDAFSRGAFHRVPVVNGTTRDESTYFIAANYDLIGKRVTAEGYPAGIQAMAFVSPEQARRVAEKYPLGDFPSPALALAKVATDANFACPALNVDHWLAARVPTYAYEFDDPKAPQLYLGPVSFPYGAYHASELQYLFKIGNAVYPGSLTQDQQTLAATMRRHWTSFATHHAPATRAVWPRFTESGQSMISYRLPAPATSDRFATDHHCGFWNDLRTG